MMPGNMLRHARVGSQVVRRQLSTFSAVRSIRIQTPVHSLRQRTASSLISQPRTTYQVIARLYSSESAQHVETDIESADEASPARVTRFADLTKLGIRPEIIRAITEGMKYETMTDVQSMTITPALNGLDLVAQAKTGTGKTLGFLVPVLQRILTAQPELGDSRTRRRARCDDIKAIILSPTRELAEQIGVEAQKLVRHTGLVVQTAVGGTRKTESLMRMQRQGCDILVATPGRLIDILSDSRSGVAAPRLTSFVLDEADRMLDVGFSDAIRDILRYVPDIREVDRQTLLYSATIPRNVVQLAKSLVKVDNFEFVQTIQADEAPVHEKVPQYVVACNGMENWYPAILEIATKAQEKARSDPTVPPFKAIVFFSHTASVQMAMDVFSSTSLGGRNGMPIFDIHSKLSQGQRTRAAESFRRAKTGILLSSDVTARGMDFPNVSHVIQVGLPPDRDQYIHRVGRTGRAGNAGEGWLLLAEPEIKEARDRLYQLPIKPNSDLATAKHRVGIDEPSPEVQSLFDEVANGYRRLPEGVFDATYNAMLSQKPGRSLRTGDIAALLNDWSKNGLGQEEPPAISMSTARNRGLLGVPGINIAGGRGRERSDEGFGRPGGRPSGNTFGDRFLSQDDSRGGFSRGGFNRGDRFNSGDRDQGRFSSNRDRGEYSSGRGRFGGNNNGSSRNGDFGRRSSF